MKKILGILIVIAISIFTLLGCKTIPSTDKITKISKSVGKAVAIIANKSPIDYSDRVRIIEITSLISRIIPEQDQKFIDVWVPAAQEYINQLETLGKLTPESGDSIILIVTQICKGIDYMFDVKYPKLRTYDELVNAAMDGFFTGFLSRFKPEESDLMMMSIVDEVDYDLDTYNYLDEQL